MSISQLEQCVQKKEYDIAIPLLLYSINKDINYQTLSQLEDLASQIPLQAYMAEGFELKKMVFLGEYHSTQLQKALHFHCLSSKIYLQFFDGFIDQYEHEILNPRPSLLKFAPDFVHFSFSLGTINSWPHGQNIQETITTETTRIHRLLTAAHNINKAVVTFDNFTLPKERVFGHAEGKFSFSNSGFIKRLNEHILTKLPSHTYLNDVAYLSENLGKANWNPCFYWDNRKGSFPSEAVVAYSYNLANLLRDISDKAKKCLVLDTDQILWQGALADKATTPLQIGPVSTKHSSHQGFQSYLSQLKARGTKLVICTQNDEQKVKDIFLNNKEMVLKLDQLDCLMANWEPFDINLQQISDDTGIKLDEMVLFSKNEAEIENVKMHLPQVSVFQVPAHIDHYIPELDSSALFSSLELDPDYTTHMKKYPGRISPPPPPSSFFKYGDYLNDLAMKALVSSFFDSIVPAIVSMVNLRNGYPKKQRFSKVEIENIMGNQDIFTNAIQLADRHENHGLSSVIIGSITEKIMKIESWIVAPHLQRRGIEILQMNQLFEFCKTKNRDVVLCPYDESHKQPAIHYFFHDLGFSLQKNKKGQPENWQIQIDDAYPKQHFIQMVKYS